MRTLPRWALTGSALILVLGLASLLLLNVLNADPARIGVEEQGGRRTWTVHGGDSARLPANEVLRDDRYRCEVDGSAYTVRGTPPRGRVSQAGDLTVATLGEGTVIVTCSPEPAPG